MNPVIKILDEIRARVDAHFDCESCNITIKAKKRMGDAGPTIRFIMNSHTDVDRLERFARKAWEILNDPHLPSMYVSEVEQTLTSIMQGKDGG